MIKNSYLSQITKERPVGTKNNEEVVKLLNASFMKAGYEVKSLPFDCLVWEKEDTLMFIGDKAFEVYPSPFSKAFEGIGEAIFIETLEQLEKQTLMDKIVILHGEIAKNAIQPKDYPFYYPEEDKRVITRLENQKPKAIVAATGQAQLSGLNPFPLFGDGNFEIPSVFVHEDKLAMIQEATSKGESITLKIGSRNIKSKSSQLIAAKKTAEAQGKIIVCAHMDTQYNTMGAIDNATGVATLMGVMERLKDTRLPYNIEFVPFNGEEYFESTGEVKYLEYLNKEQEEVALVINIDSPCHKQSKTAVSYYNINENQINVIEEVMKQQDKVEKGAEWYAGDHCMFAFSGTPTLAISSSDLFEGALRYTHTPNDTIETVDETLIESTAQFLAELIICWGRADF